MRLPKVARPLSHRERLSCTNGICDICRNKRYPRSFLNLEHIRKMLLWGRGSWDRAGSRCHPREQRNKELEVLEKGSGSYRHHMTSSLGEGLVSALHISDERRDNKIGPAKWKHSCRIQRLNLLYTSAKEKRDYCRRVFVDFH
jgi:hypothetical protein